MDPDPLTPARHGAEVALHASAEQYRTLIDHLPRSAITLVGPDLRLQWFGGGVPREAGLDVDAMLGQPIRDVSGGGEHGARVERLYRRALDGEAVSAEVHSQITGRAFSVEIAPVHGPDGQVTAALGVAQDITQRKQSEAAIAEERRRLTEAQALAQLGSWEYELTQGLHGESTWSAEMWRILGEEPCPPAPTLSDFLDRVHADDRDRIRARIHEAIATMEPFRDEFRMLRAGGAVAHVELRSEVVRDNSGTPVGARGTMQDVTSQRELLEQVRAATERAERIFDDAPIGMAVVALDGRWLRVNQALCRMTGYSEDDLLARTFQDITHPDDLEGDLDLVRRLLAGEIRSYELEKRYMRSDGTTVWVNLAVSLLRGPDGEVQEFIAQIEDITDRRTSAVARRLEGEITENMAEGALLIRAHDLVVVHANATTERMFGYEPGELAGQHMSVLNAPSASTPQEVAVAIAGHVQDGEGQWSGEIRSLRKNGTSFWRSCTVTRFEHDEHGPVLVSVLADVTERREREAEEQAFAAIATLVAEGAEPAAVFAAVATELRECFEARTAAVIRLDVVAGHGMVVGSFPASSVFTGTAVDLGGPTAFAEVVRIGRPARSRWGTTGIAAPIQVSGTLWGTVGAAFGGQEVPPGAELRLTRFARLVALAIANAQAFQTLEQQASTDALTGIANHRTFHERLRSEFERARRYDRDVSLVLLDVDHFKRVNDLHGHQVGDRVLAEIADRLAGAARAGELVARIGGEEFAWLMPETSQEGAYAAAERARAAIEDAPFEDVGTLTISAGVCAGDHARDGEELLSLADRALYRAKNLGRNTTSVYAGEPGAVRVSSA